MTTPLPAGYRLHHPDPGTAAAVQAVLDAAESADSGEPRRHMTVVATQWEDPECRIERDWWVVEAPGGGIVGVAWVWPELASDVIADHYVHPEHRGLGLGEVLLDTIESRVSELPPRGADGAPAAARRVERGRGRDATPLARTPRLHGRTAVLRDGSRPARCSSGAGVARGRRRTGVPQRHRRQADARGRRRGVRRTLPLQGRLLRDLAALAPRRAQRRPHAVAARLGRRQARRVRHGRHVRRGALISSLAVLKPGAAVASAAPCSAPRSQCCASAARPSCASTWTRRT